MVDPQFVDLALDREGIVYLLDNTSGRIYQHDQDGMLLSVFGGTGRYAGRFIDAVSIDADSRGNLYVLDANSGSVHMFQPTAFIRKVKEALRLYYNGEYEASVGPWREILDIDSGYVVAHLGMGKAYMKQREWRSAMDEYRAAGDRTGYSLAFTELRKDLFRRYFGLVILAAGLALFGLVRLLIALRKKQAALSI